MGKKGMLVMLVTACMMGLFVSCDSSIRSKISSFMGGLSGNLYESSGLVASSTASTEAVTATVTNVGTGSTTITAGGISVSGSNTLTVQDSASAQALVSNVAASLTTEKKKEELKAEMSKPVDDAKQAETKDAVNGSIQLVNDTIAAIKDKVGPTSEVGKMLDTLTMKKVGDSDNVTQGDVLVAQMMTNILGEAATTLTAANPTSSENMEKAVNLVSNLMTVAQVASTVGGTNQDYLSGISVASLVDSLSKGVKSGKSTNTQTIEATDIDDYLNAINPVVKNILSVFPAKLNSETNKYEISDADWTKFVKAQSQYRASVELGMAIATQCNVAKALSDLGVGINVNQMLSYTLSVVITELNGIDFGVKPNVVIADFINDNQSLYKGTIEKGKGVTITYPEIAGLENTWDTYTKKTTTKASLATALKTLLTMNTIGGANVKQLKEFLEKTPDEILDLVKGGQA